MINIIDFIPTGMANAVSQGELSAITGLDKRTIRQAILNARKSGAVICSNCIDKFSGYYIPANKYEAMAYLKQQQSRLNNGYIALQSVQRFVEEFEE